MMYPKPSQNLSRYCLPLSLAVLGSFLTADIVRSQTTASNPVPRILSDGVPVVINVSSEQSLANMTKLAQQGRNYHAAGPFSDAAKSWHLAAKAFQAQGDTLNQASSLNQLSLAHQQLGSYSKATEAIRDSLKLLQNQGGSKEQLKILAQTLNIQGQLQLAQGQAQRALSTWQRAERMYTQAGEQVGVIGSSINQAQALQALGLYRRALTILNQVNQKLQKQPGSAIKVAGLRSLGNTLRVVGNLDQSRQVLNQSLILAQQLKLPQDISAALFSLGNTAHSQQDSSSALKFYQQASTSATPSTRLKAQLNQLSLLLDTEQWSAAQALLPQIQSKVSNLPPGRPAIYARINFAQSLRKQGSRGAISEQGSRGKEKNGPPNFRTSA